MLRLHPRTGGIVDRAVSHLGLAHVAENLDLEMISQPVKFRGQVAEGKAFFDAITEAARSYVSGKITIAVNRFARVGVCVISVYDERCDLYSRAVVLLRVQS